MQIGLQDQLLASARASAPIAEIAGIVSAFAGEVYLVGGTVRDLIVDRGFIDVDLAVDGDPAALATAIGSVTGLETRFGTVSVERDGWRYDLARTRNERYPHPGALPEVEPASIDADLRRRDFTVNALALGLAGPRTGELIVAPGALEDLERGQLAVLHERSFLDDPTRLLRLARYAARLGFAPASHTRELAAAAIAGNALDTISGTRIGNELRLLAAEPDPIAAFEAVRELGLPWTIDPELARGALGVLPDGGRSDIVALACVFAGRLETQLIPMLDRLGFTAQDREAILDASTRAPELARRLSSTRSRAEIARAVGTSGLETVALAFSQGARSPSLTWLRELRHLHLQISGSDLIRNGIPEGPQIGQALARARDAMMDGEAPDCASQLRVALRSAE